jgi:hypothetical protein
MAMDWWIWRGFSSNTINIIKNESNNDIPIAPFVTIIIYISSQTYVYFTSPF